MQDSHSRQNCHETSGPKYIVVGRVANLMLEHVATSLNLNKTLGILTHSNMYELTGNLQPRDIERLDVVPAVVKST